MTSLGWGAAWRIARRDLNPRLRGLRLLFICLFLGVAALSTIGSLTAAIGGALADQGQEILGGDLEVGMTQRRASDREKAAFARIGRVSETIRLRAMAHRAGAPAGDAGPQAVLTELKAVDQAYPLYGRLLLAGGGSIAGITPQEIVIDRALGARLAIGPGDRLRYGAAEFRVKELIEDEPDRVGEGFTLGPVAMVSMAGLQRTGLVQPGSLYEAKYRIRMPPGTDPEQAREGLNEQFPSSGWEMKDRDRAAPGTSRFFERMGQFLSLIGLTALVVAGIGVSNGVSSYLGMKQGSIATLKVLGASSGDVARIYMLQVGAVAAAAILCGAIAGILLPIALIALAGDVFPVRVEVKLFPLPLATSAAYGLLIALIFTLPPLARARLLPAAALFRSVLDRRGGWDRRTLVPVGAALAALLLLALATAREPLFSAAVLGATAGTTLLLILFGWAVKRLAARLPRPRRPLLRLALANLHRPGAQTAPLIVALGLGLTLFVTLAAIQTSLANEISRTVPARAPNQFVLDIPVAEKARFETLVRRAAPGAEINIVPTLRGTITAFGGQRVADLEKLPDNAWFLRGERGVTYSDTLPDGSDLVSGRWWPKDYAGPPLVSIDREAADTLGLKVGDSLTVSVLGREIDARIASLRQVNWETMGFNYIMVFSPSALASAPHNLAATITMEPSHQARTSRALLAAFPAISVIDVGEVIGRVREMLDQLSVAIVMAGSVAILAGIAVLVGAIAASRQARSYDSVILKTLGATRGQILSVQGLEYALLALLLALVALGLGLGAGWYVIVEIFEFNWSPDWPLVLATLGVGALATLGIGLLGSIPLMSVRPASALRDLQLS